MNDNYLLHRNYKGFELNHRIEYQIAADSKLVVFLQNNFRCYTLEELDNILPDTPCLNTLKAINPDLIVPLSGKGKLNGIIILGDRISENIFSQVEKEYLLDIASLAGIAIDNARLYEMATTDMMTHLKIHHFFKTALADEIKKSLNKKLPLSLIMIDIDHFKNFNDTYGHTCGDLVIINVAEVIMKNIRQSDIASRYGGEEFAVILPGGDISESLIVAKRILKHVETSIVEYDDKELSVTVSIGITQFDPIFDKTYRKLDQLLIRYIDSLSSEDRLCI